MKITRYGFRNSVLTLAMASLAMSPMALAQGGRGGGPGLGGGPGKGPGAGMMTRLVDELNLSQKQRDTIKQIRLDQEPTLTKLGIELDDARTSLRLAVDSAKSTEKEMRALFDACQKLKQQHAKSRFEMMLAIRGVLTPAQRKEFAQKRDAWRSEGRFGRGQGKGRRGRR